VGFGVNVGGVVSMFDSCTFVDNNGTGDGSGQTAFAVMDDGDVVIAQNIIVQDTASVGRPGNANATININNLLTNNVAELQVSGTPGTLNVTGMLVSDDPGLTSGGGLYYMTGNPTYSGWGWRSVSGSARAPEPWPVYGNGIQRKGYYTGGMTLTAGGIVWTNTTQIGPVSQGIYGSASADDTYLYVAVDPYNVDGYSMLAIDLTDGSLSHGAYFVDWANGTPAVAMSYAYCGDNAGWVYCVNKADGAIIWSNHIGGDINSGINLNGGVVYAKAGGNGLYALDGDTGAPIWSNLNADASTWSGNGPSMSADGSKIYYKTETGDIVGVNTADGSTIFTYTAGANGWGGQDPIVDDSGNVYCQLRGLEAAPDDDVVVSLSPTGAVNWTYTFTGHPMDHGGLALCEAQMTLYVSNNDGIKALNTSDGTEKWSSTGVNAIKGGIAVGAGNMIMAVARQGASAPEATVVGVKDNGTSGDLVWQVPLDAGQDSWSGPVILENGDVVVCTDGGEIARVTVPEPGVLGALVLGLLLLIRRK
jgi:outer membrane protein assembly factor BamB